MEAGWGLVLAILAASAFVAAWREMTGRRRGAAAAVTLALIGLALAAAVVVLVV